MFQVVRAAGLAVALMVPGLTLPADGETGRLSVSGRAEMQVAPDIAVVTLGVVVDEENAVAAMASASDTLRDIFAVLHELDIPDADIQTSQFSLNPVYSNRDRDSDQAPQVVGYQVRNLVSVSIRDVASAGSAVDRLASAGVNSVSGISFEVSEPEQYADELRRKAVQDARHAAEVFAEAAGLELGTVLVLSDVAQGGRPMPVMARAEMAMDMPLAPGSVGLTAQVEMVFAIE